MSVDFRGPSWFRRKRGWVLSWWMHGPFRSATLLGVTVTWWRP